MKEIKMAVFPVTAVAQVATVVLVLSLAWGHPYAAGTPKREEKKKKKRPRQGLLVGP